LIFDTLVVGALESNCYVLADDGPEALVIDPGGDASRIIGHLDAKGLEAVSLVNTHGHADHIAGNAELRKRYPDMTIAIGRDDAKALRSPLRNMSLFIARLVKSPPADRLLDDGDVVEFGRWRFRVLATPGHTPGGICLFSEDLDPSGTPLLVPMDSESASRPDGLGVRGKGKTRRRLDPEWVSGSQRGGRGGGGPRPVLFSGDTLFADSVGRTDIPGGSWDDLIRGIRQKIFVLPDETEVYPGHGPATTVAHEKKFNPFAGEQAE